VINNRPNTKEKIGPAIKINANCSFSLFVICIGEDAATPPKYCNSLLR
jgi:hypothetical protein